MNRNDNQDMQGRAYIEEAEELLQELEEALIELEETPDDDDLINRVFRAMHTIKGSGAMFGFDDIASFTHEVETVFDLVRCGKMSVTKELMDATLAARDQIKALLDASTGGRPADKKRGDEIIDVLRRLAPEGESTVNAVSDTNEKSSHEDSVSSEKENSQCVFRVRFKPKKEIFLNGTNLMLLINEFRQLGKTSVVAQLENIPMIDELNPEYCYTYWDVLVSTDKGINGIRDVFIFVENDCEITIDMLTDSTERIDDIQYKKLGDILVEKGDLTRDDLERVLNRQKRIGEMIVEEGLTDNHKIKSALEEQKHIKELKETRKKKEEITSIRVSSDKLDKLVNLVGELVTVQARLSQTAAGKNEQELLSIAEEVERLTWELRDNTMNVRMVAIGATFIKFKRLIRDLSSELGREIELVTEGAETELDKTVIERLNDPLVHLIRNSIDHGIEPPEIREAKGKPRQGTIRLKAMHSGANVIINVIDDGAGLNKETIFKKAVEKGLVSADAELTEDEIYSLILMPGFSTAGRITNVSGRGVGMDVVKRNIEALSGTVDIKSSKDIGTTISLKLPLTLAIIDGLLVQIEDDYFVIQLSIVEECVELTREDVRRANGNRMAKVRGELVPYIRLREIFGIDGSEPEIEQIVIIDMEGNRVGFVVDQVIGEHQTVIKNLGNFYKGIECISGATILGDGSVALILDIPKIAKTVENHERRLAS